MNETRAAVASAGRSLESSGCVPGLVDDGGGGEVRSSERRENTHSLLLGGGLALLAEEHRVDVGEDTARGDGHAREELGELLVVADGQLDVAGHDAGLLVVAGRVSGELEDLGGQVLEDGGEVDGGAGADARRELALLQVAGDTADRELEAGLGRLRDGLLAGGLAFAAARHCESFGLVLGGGGR